MPELKQQGDLLVRMADEVVELIARLESMKGVAPHLDAIEQARTEGDTVFRHALARLFSGQLDALERSATRTSSSRWRPRSTSRTMSDVVESIVLKHA